MKKRIDDKDLKLFGRALRTIIEYFTVDVPTLCEYMDEKVNPSSVSSWITRYPPGAEETVRQLVNAFNGYLWDRHATAYFDKTEYKTKIAAAIGEYCKVPEFLTNENDYSVIELVSITLEFAYAHKNLKTQDAPAEKKPDHVVTPPTVRASSAKTEAIVFDFDGTLTTTNKVRTTWETIWTMLGYSVQDCVDLHLKFNNGEISHQEWCDLTAAKFIERKLHRDQLDPLIENTKLINGIEDVFKELDRRDIKLYIVSGSIKYIIRRCLGGLAQYVSGGINANVFDFDEAGYLTQIIGTDYDFAGKAARICKIAEELKISTNQILFVGNSLNDEWAHESGARTLAINPKNTNMFNKTIWDNCIVHCESLLEIMKYV